MALTQLKCEDTATPSGVTHIVQPAGVSLFVRGDLMGKVRNADDKEQKEIHLINLIWLKEWRRRHLDSFSVQMLEEI